MVLVMVLLLKHYLQNYQNVWQFSVNQLIN